MPHNHDPNHDPSRDHGHGPDGAAAAHQDRPSAVEAALEHLLAERPGTGGGRPSGGAHDG
jgi:hypothetical protein